MKVLDWLADMLGLPAHFKFSEPGHGGGVIHGTASEATLVALLVARSRAIGELRKGARSQTIDSNNNTTGPLGAPELGAAAGYADHFDQSTAMERLVGYCSELAHSSVERAGLLGGVCVTAIQSDDECRLRGAALRQQILEDKAKGLVPFFVVATLGTTSVCTFDDLHEIGLVCREFGLWLHVDAAYAGNSFVCPENRQYMRGIEVSHRIDITCAL